MVKIYTGPSMVAKSLVARLNEVGIQPVIRNDHASATLGGFAMGVPDQLILSIRKDQLEQAQPIIDSFLSELEAQ